MILRSILLFCLLHLSSMIFADRLHYEGDLLCRLKNLPHRGLGMLWWAYILQPERADYMRDYLAQYLIYTDGEMLLEGSTKPVVPMMAVRAAREFPKNKDLDAIRMVVMANYFKRLEKETKESEASKPSVEIKEGWVKEE